MTGSECHYLRPSTALGHKPQIPIAYRLACEAPHIRAPRIIARYSNGLLCVQARQEGGIALDSGMAVSRYGRLTARSSSSLGLYDLLTSVSFRKNFNVASQLVHGT
jgi:hypothetical protein